MGMFDYVTVQVQSTPNSSGYDVALHVPAGTGLQLKTSETDPCTYDSTKPHVWPTPGIVYHRLGSTFALVRCSLGDGVTDLTFVGRIREGNNAYSVGSYAEVEDVPQSWHQADHSVTYYVLGTEGNRIRATSTTLADGMFPYSFTPKHVNEALTTSTAPYNNAAAAWTGVNAGVSLATSNSYTTAEVRIQGYYRPGSSLFGCRPGTIACVEHSVLVGHIRMNPLPKPCGLKANRSGEQNW